MTVPTKPDLIPRAIEGYWLADEGFLSEYALLDCWTPFESACLLHSYKPGQIVNGVARIGLVPAEINQYEENPQDWVDPDVLIRLTEIILKNNDGEVKVRSKSIVSWAVDNTLLHPKSYLAGRLLPDHNDVYSASAGDDEIRQRLDKAMKQIDLLTVELEQARKRSKETGKEHAQNRSRILAAATREMALHCKVDGELIRAGEINSSALARSIDERRDVYQLPPADKRGFSYENILNTIRLALSEKGDQYSK